ncbi:hypothetical protein D3C80_1281520 [compost metagenome]
MTNTADFGRFWHGRTAEAKVVEFEEDAVEQFVVHGVAEELFDVLVDGVGQGCNGGGVPHLQDQRLEVGYQPCTFWISRLDRNQDVTQRYNSTFTQRADAQWQLAAVYFYDAFPAFVIEDARADVTIDEFLRTLDVAHGHGLHQELLDDGR